ncbi:recombinase [Fimbriimonas ginsengisoli Gsoil 348]|uniref:Recombinase n=1 Tax=Fimbriimonas ginsengisoli Gsoil 348 TaxID=661478 RepID=A0A068NPJ2_FIMGI|nr:recombinase [Fimbriimonas ginsengisoli Gsoil 348]
MPRPRKSTIAKPLERERCVIYCRVSSEDQAKGYSLDAQLRALRAYVAERDFETEAVFVEDETARKAGRREFREMVKALSGGEIRHLVAEKTDRMYRNFRDRVTIGDLIEDGLQLHLATEREILHKDSPAYQKFVHDIRTVVAKNFSDNLSEEARKGMREKAAQGIWPSSAPLGYRNVSVGAVRTIEPDPMSAKQVTAFFEAYATGDHSIKTAAVVAQAIGLRSRKGARVAVSALHQMLQNPLYKGEIMWKGVTYPGKHVPLVSEATWAKVQQVLGGRAVNCAGFGRREYAYRGIFTCGRCGCAMTPESKKDGRYVYYSCTGFKGCPRLSVSEAAITDQIAAHLERLTIRPTVMDMLREALRLSYRDVKTESEARLADLRTEAKRLAGSLERLYLDSVAGNVPAAAYPKLKAKWEMELATVDEQIAAYGRANRATWEDNVQMLELVSNSAARFKTASIELRRAMLKSLLSKSQILDGKVILTMRPEFNLILQANLELIENPTLETDFEKWQGRQDSNPRPAVLETAALPTELHPCVADTIIYQNRR